MNQSIKKKHFIHYFSQDKYLMDMDELFSQVDEKRKVSIKIFFTHLFAHSPHSAAPAAGGVKLIALGSCLSLQTLSLTAHTLTAHQHCMIVDMATRA